MILSYQRDERQKVPVYMFLTTRSETSILIAGINSNILYNCGPTEQLLSLILLVNLLATE
jgi:hypothetical protein